MDPSRAIDDLRELDRRTGGDEGARRVAWTRGWARARDFLGGLLEELPGVETEVDAAGNLWATLAGERDELVVVGSHIDSVPGGGWLDGALGVMGGLELLRSLAEAGQAPPRSVALVDWADEEGARFGRSLLGSSAFAGTLAPEEIARLVDRDGVTLAAALAEHGVDAARMASAGAGRRERIAAYVELHIEQGPVLEAEGLACAAVEGTVGVERHRVSFTGRAAHAGSTPMEHRSDALVAGARAILGLQEIAHRHGGVCTVGGVAAEPGIATAVPGRAELLVDQRHLDPSVLAAMFAEAWRLWEGAAGAEDCAVEAERIWGIAPTPFHEGLAAAAAAACAEVTGVERALPSGALHDAAELARVVPAAMIFCSSSGGVSHAPEEDTPEADLEQALRALGLLARRVIDSGVT